MNQECRDSLRKAALLGVKQAYGRLEDNAGGYCALGWLNQDVPMALGPLFNRRWTTPCPLCETFPGPIPSTELGFMVHLNDTHRLDFLAIAEKMPPEEIPG
jgi:hypothetical protein